MSAILSLPIPEPIKTRLQSLSRNTNKPVSFYVLKALDTYLEDLEDYYEAEAIMKQVETGEERTYTLEEVGEVLGLER